LEVGDADAFALCALAVLRLWKFWRLRADDRGDKFDGERCANSQAGAGGGCSG